ncbi:hypothetical protein N0V95_003425 [Ascochyta clinopodiicola]|nr:hypothetical protein N0V95_003425 [Ascochyta clinopodiicola]
MTRAGSGTYGDVYFCLPTSTIITVQNHSTAQADLTAMCDELTKQLVAIKICQGPSIPTLRNELAVLQIIATTNHAATLDTACGSTLTNCDAFFLCLDYATNPSSDTHYLTSTTLPLICTLDALLPNVHHLPEPFTWLIYVKIRKALIWLTKTCNPGIAHGDVHAGNILIGYATLDPGEGQRLPLVKMVDFGNSHIADAEAGYGDAGMFHHRVSRDWSAFLHLLAVTLGLVSTDGQSPSRLHGRSPCSGGEESSVEFREFRTRVERAVKRGSWDHEEGLAELESRFGGFAERVLSSVGEGECGVVWDKVVSVTEESRGAVRRRVGGLLGVVSDEEEH